jgi:hypothetical protein
MDLLTKILLTLFVSGLLLLAWVTRSIPEDR